MKNQIFFLLSAISFASVACAKIETTDNTVKQSPVEIKGVIISDKDSTPAVKSNYDLDENTGTFYWTGVEKIGILNFYSSDPYFWEDPFTSTTSADNKETSLVFSGTPSNGGAYLTDYALYPIWNGTTHTGIGWSSSPKFKLYIPESQAYNAEAPLKDVVPMIAKKDGEGNYAFKSVTAIIEVNVKNLPAGARKITLSSTGTALSGYYLLTSTPANYADNIDYVIGNGLTVNIAKNGGNTDGKKTITFDSGLGKGEYSFYFPVSVGVLPDLTIAIKGSDDSVLQSVSYPKSITTARGNITRLPLLDLARATSLTIAGTAAAPTAYLNQLGPDAASIKYAVAASADDAKAAAATGAVVSATGSENAFSITPEPAVSGQYYLGYVVYASDSNVLGTYSLPFGYLGASDVAAYIGQFAAAGQYSNNSWAVTSTTITFDVSDNPSKGNIMITEFDGLYCDVSKNTHGISGNSTSTYDPSNFGSYTDGQPIYGIYNGTPGSNTNLVFKDVLTQVFYTDQNESGHVIGCASSTGTPNANLEMSIGWGKAYRDTNYKFICTRGYIGNYYKSGTNAYPDYHLYQFGAGPITE